MKPWKENVEEYATQFYGSLWQLGGEKPWIEEVDFGMLFGAAVQSYFPPELNVQVDAMTFADVLNAVPEAANDYSRFHWHAPEIMKKHVRPQVQKSPERTKVYNAIDTAREETVKLGLIDTAREETVK